MQDRIHEGNETILVDAALGTGEGGPAVGARQSVVIEDDDPEPQPTFTVSRETIGEGAETSTVTVSTGTGSTFAADRTVTLTLAAEGTATEHDDFTIGSKSLTLPAGVGTTPSEITTVVAAVQDRIDEADEETILVDAAIGTDAVGSRRTVAVVDDDGAPELEFRASATQIAENGGVSTLTITTGTGSTYEAAQTVTVSAADGTALEGSDYEVGETDAHPPGRLGPRSLGRNHHGDGARRCELRGPDGPDALGLGHAHRIGDRPADHDRARRRRVSLADGARAHAGHDLGEMRAVASSLRRYRRPRRWGSG